MKLAGLVFSADELNRHVFGLRRYAAIFGWSEAKLENLRIKIVDGSAKMHGIPHSDGDEKNIGEDERVGRLDRDVIAGKDPLLLDARPGGLNSQLELDFACLRIVMGDVVGVS